MVQLFHNQDAAPAQVQTPECPILVRTKFPALCSISNNTNLTKKADDKCFKAKLVRYYSNTYLKNPPQNGR